MSQGEFQTSGKCVFVDVQASDLVRWGTLREDSPLNECFGSGEFVPLVDGREGNFESQKNDIPDTGRAYQVDCPRLTPAQRERIADVLLQRNDARREEIIGDLHRRDGLGLDARHFSRLFAMPVCLVQEGGGSEMA